MLKLYKQNELFASGVMILKKLVVVDMQNDFIDGSLGTKEAVAIVDNVKNKIGEYNPSDVYVTLDTHGPNYLNTQEGQNLPVEHCIKGTYGWQLSPAIEERMARRPNLLPLSLTFMRLITMALMLEPARNATRDATAVLGAAPNTVLKASWPSQKGAPGRATTSCAAATKKKFIANPVQITSLALRYP